MSNRLALCNTVLSGPRPVDLSTGFSILPGRPEAIEKSIGSAAFLSACEGHNTRSQAVGSGPFINRYSVEFDGVDDYVQLPNSTDLEASEFTWSAWFYCGAIDRENPIIDASLSANTFNGYHIRVMSNNKIRFSSYHSNDMIDSTTLVTANTWFHVAGTHKSGSDKLYLNGSLEASGNASHFSVSSTANLRLGTQTLHSTIIQGLIDEVSFFNSSLTESDIASIYNEGTPNDISSLEPVGWWRMGDSNSGVGTTLTDVGSGGNDGTLENGAEFIDKTVLRKPEDATVVYNYPETSDIPIKPIDLSVSLSDEGAGLIDPTDLQVLLYPPNLRISIQDTEENILARTGDTAGTMAFGTDTNNLYIANTEGFDSWSSIEDN